MQPLPEIDLPQAPSWSMALGTAGRVLIWSGLASFLVAVIASLFFSKTRVGPKLVTIGFISGAAALLSTFGVLAVLFATDRFEFKYVYEHAQLGNALKYRIAGIWSGQQGSFLLWACTSAIFGLLTFARSGIYRRWYTAIFSLFLASLCGILAYETPFSLHDAIHGVHYVPPDGVGLAPSLQNYWVVIHPPTIFFGFGSLTVGFAYALSALIMRQYKEWAPMVRPWALVSLALVGVGLCMGGFWAYETLGWGGFWMWDPVENVSFVPWAFTAALIHGIIVQVTKDKWHFSNLLLAGAPFLLFVYGTFLTRAGFLDGVSVHSFAQMDRKAHMVLLTLCILSTVGFLSLWGFRALKDNEPKKAEPGMDREKWYRFASILLVLTGLSTAIGMSVPMFQAIAGKQPKVVEEHVYHNVLSWYFIPIMLMIAIGPFVSWRSMPLRELAGRILNVFSITIGLLGLLMIVMNHPRLGIGYEAGSTVDFPWTTVKLMPWMIVLIGICLFAGVANLWRLVEMWKRSKPSAGAFMAHAGVAILMAGLIVSRGFEKKDLMFLQDGVPFKGEKLGYFIGYKGMTSTVEDKYNKVQVSVTEPGGGNFLAEPGFYYAQSGEELKPMVWPHIQHKFSHDVYFTLHPPEFNAMSEPIVMKPGETKDFEILQYALNDVIHYKVKFDKMNRIGEAGVAGTRFTAPVTVTTEDGETVRVEPGLTITNTGLQPMLGQINKDFLMRLESMNVADRSVTLSILFARPIYPVEMYYKPMTILVWLGTGILTLGALLSAFARRRVRRLAPLPEKVEESAVEVIQKEDALVPVA